MDKQTVLENWSKFSTYMYNRYLPRTIGKYGDSRLEDVTSQDTRYWNIIRYATRLMAGRGKKHDLEKIVHYAQMAWVHNVENGVGPVDAKDLLVMVDGKPYSYYEVLDEDNGHPD